MNRFSVAFVLGGTVLLAILSYAVFTIFNSPSTQTTNLAEVPVINKTDKPTEITSGLPVSLQIPKLEVDAKVLYKGLTPDGDMDVPENNFKDVGWYQYGFRPGNAGTAVIAGHVNGKNERGVFIELHKLVNGDTIKIVDDKNNTISFVVRDIRNYDQNDRPEEVFNSGAGSHLNLITCAGSWNANEQRFPIRLVVFADKIEN